jgi:hypothetical protein
VDGILYKWQTYDTLEGVAAKYHASVQDILLFPGNDLDITNPVIEPGTTIMIPNGYRETQTNWVVSVAIGSNSGVTAQIAGPGSCTPSGGSVGTLSFIWPTPYYGQVSGNDYWSGHQPSMPYAMKVIRSMPWIPAWSSMPARSAAATATW